jgi:branched-chain amino acid transport system ATP-binding protein
MTLLNVEGLGVRFGGVTAVSDVNLSVEQGTLVGLIGSNGAGKTTLLDALTGFVSATGAATFDGHSLIGIPAHKRVRLGVCRTWQSVELFDDLTVYENLCVAGAGGDTRSLLLSGFWKNGTRSEHEMRALLDTLELDDILDRYPGDLSEGERKLVGLARTLMSNPKLVLADEPAAGLDSAQSIRLGTRLRALVDNGLTILLVDHDMGLVLSVCDYIYVLDHGQLIAQGTPAEVRTNPAVLTAYLGGGAEPVGDDGGGRLSGPQSDDTRVAGDVR